MGCKLTISVVQPTTSPRAAKEGDTNVQISPLVEAKKVFADSDDEESYITVDEPKNTKPTI